MGKKKGKETKPKDPKAGKAKLMQNGEPSDAFKHLWQPHHVTYGVRQCLVEIFARFDADKDNILSEQELLAFSRCANQDGREFTRDSAEDLSRCRLEARIYRL